MNGRPNRLTLTLAFLLTAALSALLGFGVASWRAARTAEDDAKRLRMMQAEARCSSSWANRSGATDAEYQFRRGRRSLLEIIGATDPGIEYVIPGVRKGAGVPATQNLPVPWPRLDGLELTPDELRWVRGCKTGLYIYAHDYNAAMMRLLGRRGDTYIRYLSPEIVALDTEAAKH